MHYYCRKPFTIYTFFGRGIRLPQCKKHMLVALSFIYFLFLLKGFALNFFIKRLLFILFPLIFSTELFFIRLCLAGIITESLSLSFDIYKDVPSFICLSLGIYKIFCHLLHCSTLVPTTLSFFIILSYCVMYQSYSIMRVYCSCVR